MLLLSGCGQLTEIKDQLLDDHSEQLYIDAELGFSVKHPLDWERIKPPQEVTAAPTNRVGWRIADPEGQVQQLAEVQIHSFPAVSQADPSNLLRDFLAEAELTAGEEFSHPVGQARRLRIDGAEMSQVIIALVGQKRHFIFALSCPPSHLEKFLPRFHETVKSLVEISSATRPGS